MTYYVFSRPSTVLLTLLIVAIALLRHLLVVINDFI